MNRWMTEIGEKYPMSSSLIYIGQQETNLHYPRNSVLPKQQVKDEKKGSFRAPSESESESDNSQKPDNLFKDSVTFMRNAFLVSKLVQRKSYRVLFRRFH